PPSDAPCGDSSPDPAPYDRPPPCRRERHRRSSFPLCGGAVVVIRRAIGVALPLERSVAVYRLGLGEALKTITKNVFTRASQYLSDSSDHPASPDAAFDHRPGHGAHRAGQLEVENIVWSRNHREGSVLVVHRMQVSALLPHANEAADGAKGGRRIRHWPAPTVPAVADRLGIVSSEAANAAGCAKGGRRCRHWPAPPVPAVADRLGIVTVDAATAGGCAYTGSRRSWSRLPDTNDSYSCFSRGALRAWALW